MKYNKKFPLYIHKQDPFCNRDIDIKTLKGYRTKTLLVKATRNTDSTNNKVWWYCIKDSSIEIESLKKKKRYEINSSLRKYDIRIIQPKNYIEALIKIRLLANEDYPKKYRPKPKVNKWHEEIKKESANRVYEFWGIFIKDSNDIIGYAKCEIVNDYVKVLVIKIPYKHKKESATAGLVYKIIHEYINIRGFKYISDGERNVLHETNFQEYLISGFGFRKAYCDLVLFLNPILNLLLIIITPFKFLLLIFSNFRIINYLLKLIELKQIYISQELKGVKK